MTGSARILFLSAFLALCGVATASLKPATSTQRLVAPDLEKMLPEEFDGWRRVPIGALVLPDEVALGPGEAVAYRAYRDELGRLITLVVAYGPPLGDSVRLHRPETCYRAQGFSILDRSEGRVWLDGRDARIVHLDTQSPDKRESVTYLLREGATFSTSAADNPLRRMLSISAAPLDGVLIRVSTNNPISSEAGLQKTFLREFAAALDPKGKHLLLGVPEPSS